MFVCVHVSRGLKMFSKLFSSKVTYFTVSRCDENIFKNFEVHLERITHYILMAV